jgi:hypothetical protein
MISNRYQGNVRLNVLSSVFQAMYNIKAKVKARHLFDAVTSAISKDAHAGSRKLTNVP